MRTGVMCPKGIICQYINRKDAGQSQLILRIAGGNETAGCRFSIACDTRLRQIHT